MKSRITCITVLISLMLGACSVAEQPTTPTPPPELVIEVEGVPRTYHLHVPDSISAAEPTPLVVALHGLGGHGSTMNRLTGFNNLADREGFIVVYPNGQDGSWIDAGPDSLRLRQEAGIQDLAFIEQLIDQLDRDFRIDPMRIYATGISNGALFAFILACQLSERFAAVGLVAGAGITRATEECDPSEPVAYIAFHGTDDAVVPYSGREIAPGFPELGRYQSAQEAVEIWVNMNECKPPPERNKLADGDVIDNSSVIRERYAPCRTGAAVELYTIDGGGHTWPGHPRTSSALGETNRDIDATEILWTFFKDHPKQ